jgi:hypothetical protein
MLKPELAMNSQFHPQLAKVRPANSPASSAAAQVSIHGQQLAGELFAVYCACNALLMQRCR